MDEIIYLEPDEEITSAIDKIKKAKNSNLGLVVPRDATLLQSVVNLRLISKEAALLGKNIAIVTADKIGRNLAAQVGLPVYNSIRDDMPSSTPAPVSARDEVLEIDSREPAVSNSNSDDNSSRRSGPSVHHFQDDRPTIHWKSHQKPVIKQSEPVEKVTPKNIIEKVQKIDHKTKTVFWPVFLIILFLAGLAAYLLYPAATVEVMVKSEDLNKTQPIIFITTVTTPNSDQNTFPGILVTSSNSATQKFPATGQKNLGGKAIAAVTFTNGLDSLSHKYPAGTKLVASNKNYLLKADVTVPGATVSNLQVVPGSATGQIEAENAGEDYNIKATKFVITGVPANQQAALYAQSSTDLKGGFTKIAQVVSQTDYDNAVKATSDGLLTTLDQDIKTKTIGLTLVDKSTVLSSPEITATSQVDQEATDFQLTVKLSKQVMAYDYTKFTDFLIGSLGKGVSADKMIVIPSNDSIAFTIDKQAYDKGELDTTANVAAKIATKISADQIKNQIIGKSDSAARQLILGQAGVENVNISYRPTFLKMISYLAQNVTVKIEYDAKTSSNGSTTK